jgi:hypothetical protein
MAGGNPILAKQIFNELDAEWFMRWAIWRKMTREAKIPYSIIGMYNKE